MTALNHLSVAELARRLANRDVSPTEVLEAHLAAVDACDGKLRSIVTLTAGQARHDAAAATADIAAGRYRGPLHGIPYGLKDVFETKGIRTTAQSRVLADNVPNRDSHAREALGSAGAVLVGKTATWEFAHGGPSSDVLFPPARNPWDLGRSPSGSSSGSAAAVAAGLLPFALGTDTGGSIRTPAGVCGIVGLKPTYGRVSRHGVIPNSFSQDHVGPLTRTVEDAALVLQAIAGRDPRDPATSDCPVPDYGAGLRQPVRGLRIGVPYHWFEDEAPASPQVLRAFSASVEAFERLGATVRPIRLPELAAFEDVKKIIAMADLYAMHRQTLRTAPDLFGANFRGRIIAGALLGAEDLVQAQRVRGRLALAIQDALIEDELLMLPMCEPAPKLAETPSSNLFTTLGFAAAFNVAGNPALSLPNGWSEEGLPLSLQLVGRLFDEATVLQAGHAFEQTGLFQPAIPEL